MPADGKYILIFTHKKGIIIRQAVLAVQYPKERPHMINFEEELAKFKPSLEVDETEKAILNDKMTDITDILQELMEQIKK